MQHRIQIHLSGNLGIYQNHNENTGVRNKVLLISVSPLPAAKHVNFAWKSMKLSPTKLKMSLNYAGKVLKFCFLISVQTLFYPGKTQTKQLNYRLASYWTFKM